jgi:hypothetical protein
LVNSTAASGRSYGRFRASIFVSMATIRERRADAEPSDTAIDSGAPHDDLLDAVVVDPAKETVL